ncbi:PASTA domain-containing protein [Nocardioides sp. J2M5]|uniref:PASTA domain-containing protein n=1 Tax=Nocardioides palaemonis TaxID=2829810 RepID=UPI001BAC714F|nr:PASTA domain-containing protein [Nocardioides palaemonis]MBS2936872.1 PASTA domain-containing protein [Nocardioides palaemonis]
MDVEDYRAARRTRLAELARSLGVPASEAEQVVDRVIEAQRRRIARADDPDDVVVPALREEVLGGRPRRTSAVIVGFAAVVLAAFAVGVVTTGDERPQVERPQVDRDDGTDGRTPTVPSLLGLTADEAAAALGSAHIALRVVSVPQCNPAEQVLGSVPPMGTALTGDDVVTVIATSSPTWTCPDDAGTRDTAWAFLRYVVTGSARPDFAAGVRLFVDGERVGVVDGTEPGALPQWRSAVRDPVVQYVARPAPNDLGQPIVAVTRAAGDRTTCGRPSARPSGVTAAVTRLVLTAGGDAPGAGCGLTIDLFEDARGAVAAVALATPALGRSLGPPPWVRPSGRGWSRTARRGPS